MQVKRFVAADMRRALELVRNAMGPEAIILSSQRTQKGVELMTTLDTEYAVQPELSKSQEKEPFEFAKDDESIPMNSDTVWKDQAMVEKAFKQSCGNFTPDVSAKEKNLSQHPLKSQFTDADADALAKLNRKTRNSAQLAEDIERAREKMIAAKKQAQQQDSQQQRELSREIHDDVKDTPVKNQTFSAHEPDVRSVENTRRNDEHLQELKDELAQVRLLLQEQLDKVHPADQACDNSRVFLWQRFDKLGLPAELIDILLAETREISDPTLFWSRGLSRLARKIPVLHDDIVDSGGVFAMVGPTGSGKTTTIGKLAARYVLKHGSDNIALITTDTYRIAACDQLRSIGHILNVTVKTVSEQQSLSAVLQSLRHCRLILIDTAGFRQGDPALKEQLQLLKSHPMINTFLVLSCHSQLQMMKASVHAYKPARLRGCVLTRLDETLSLGEAVGVVVQHQLPIAYIADGQNIPDDIHVCDAPDLIKRTVELAERQVQNTKVNKSHERKSMLDKTVKLKN